MEISALFKNQKISKEFHPIQMELKQQKEIESFDEKITDFPQKVENEKIYQKLIVDLSSIQKQVNDFLSEQLEENKKENKENEIKRRKKNEKKQNN
ncbi:hypothetical protein M0811_04159 [Anaeramoeba ignava]|uniref:Uncharacterized protein n=1 Tax=Anaeramoeba ignava TaxID=1746090 RepID=A0A9Q0LWB5_ANAIG|nr:hypothetical protein M0811_04159 [Anaeramoeba ignava]